MGTLHVVYLAFTFSIAHRAMADVDSTIRIFTSSTLQLEQLTIRRQAQVVADWRRNNYIWKTSKDFTVSHSSGFYTVVTKK